MYYSKPQRLFLTAISLHMFLVIESKDTHNHQTTQSSVVAVRKRLSSTERSTTQAEASATPAERRRVETTSTSTASTSSTQRTTAALPTRQPSQTLSHNNGSNRHLMMTTYSLWGEWSACSAQGIQTRQRQCLHPQKCRQQDVINRTGQGRSCSTEPPYNWTKECHWVCDGEDKRICVYHIRNDYDTKGYQVSHCSSCTEKTLPMGRCWNLDVVYGKTSDNNMATSAFRREWAPQQ